MSKLTPQEIITWLRENGKRLLDVANVVEAAFAPPQGFEMIRYPRKHEITPDTIRERLRREPRTRVPQLAEELGAPEDTVRSIVMNPDNGIVMKDRGWLYLRQDLNGGTST
jgi:hypothetical protein